MWPSRPTNLGRRQSQTNTNLEPRPHESRFCRWTRHSLSAGRDRLFPNSLKSGVLRIAASYLLGGKLGMTWLPMTTNELLHFLRTLDRTVGKLFAAMMMVGTGNANPAVAITDTCLHQYGLSSAGSCLARINHLTPLVLPGLDGPTGTALFGILNGRRALVACERSGRPVSGGGAQGARAGRPADR